MTHTRDPKRDLTISRIIKAPRALVWRIWTDPTSFAEWWIPAPARCKVLEMDLSPGGALRTEMSEDGGPFVPHMDACFLAVDPLARIVFTNSLVGGWRPAPQSFMTAIITFADHPLGTEYVAEAMHGSEADRNMHETLGFFDGWGTVTTQLATMAERAT